uniref:GRB2-associated binding protein 2 n=1 Tax=Oryzias sinensis TaxID=183150 RepID=A0A8C8A3E4_9TELE
MSGGEIIFQGWLRKSPPEKKLRRYAWKKRWFILRSGRMSGDPDVLEYYKNDHSKKPIRVIDLHCCEQVDAGLTFKRKEFQDSFVFDIKTSDRTFYLVAETEEEMNKWVRSICQLCGFNQADDTHGSHTCAIPFICPLFDLSRGRLTRTTIGNSDDNYVPMNPGSSPLSASQADNPSDIYIPMTPGPHFDFPGFSATLPARKGSSASLCHRPTRYSDVTPPPINRNLKPNRKCEVFSPLVFVWLQYFTVLFGFRAAMNSVSSQQCRPISTQSITSTDSADSEENYVAMVIPPPLLLSSQQHNPVSTSPAVSGTNSPAPRKCGNVDYLALDFQPGTPSPHRKPSTSSVTSDDKVDYVQVDKEKTQALQSTMQEWTDVRHSADSAKGVKS